MTMMMMMAMLTIPQKTLASEKAQVWRLLLPQNVFLVLIILLAAKFHFALRTTEFLVLKLKMTVAIKMEMTMLDLLDNNSFLLGHQQSREIKALSISTTATATLLRHFVEIAKAIVLSINNAKMIKKTHSKRVPHQS